MDNLTFEQRKQNMERIKSKDTEPEKIFRKALWHKGIRFRKNVENVFGKPDICIKSKKIAIFIDSEFWHGKMYLEGKIPKSNIDYWIPKLERNIQRDQDVNRTLASDGWKVFRFWGKDVKKNVNSLADEVVSYIMKLQK
jgi:DNA mismatch endonuclease (patch repair protein)